MHTRMVIQSSEKTWMRPRRFGCTSGQNTFRAITRLPVELQSSRSVHLDQRDEIYLHARRELRTDKNTFRAITRLSFELQSSRLVHLDQRDEIYVHARRELHPPKAGCGMDVRSLVLYFLRCSIQAPSKGSDKAWMEVQNHGCASSHPRCFSGLSWNLPERPDPVEINRTHLKKVLAKQM